MNHKGHFFQTLGGLGGGGGVVAGLLFLLWRGREGHKRGKFFIFSFLMGKKLFGGDTIPC